MKITASFFKTRPFTHNKEVDSFRRLGFPRNSPPPGARYLGNTMQPLTQHAMQCNAPTFANWRYCCTYLFFRSPFFQVSFVVAGRELSPRSRALFDWCSRHEYRWLAEHRQRTKGRLVIGRDDTPSSEEISPWISANSWLSCTSLCVSQYRICHCVVYCEVCFD